MIFHQSLRLKSIPLEDELLVTYFGSSTVPYCVDPLQINTISFYTRFYKGPNRSTNNSFYNLSSGLNRSLLRNLVRTSIKLLFIPTGTLKDVGTPESFQSERSLTSHYQVPILSPRFRVVASASKEFARKQQSVNKTKIQHGGFFTLHKLKCILFYVFE